MSHIDEFKARLTSDLKTAMIEKNSAAVKAIRSLRAAIDNSESVDTGASESASMNVTGGIAGATAMGANEAPRKILSEKDVHEILRREIEDAKRTAELLKEKSVPDTEGLDEQILVLERYLA